jgi:threonine synthase
MAPDLSLSKCPECGGEWLEAGYDLDGVAQIWLADLPKREANLWRYAELLPITPDENLITMGEGMTPLVRIQRLGGELGLPHLFLKDERRSPTGSFKDRQSALSINIARQLGHQEIVLASTGNKAAAYAAFCARAGIRVWIFLTSMVPNEKLREMALYGAEVIKIAGTYDQAKQVAKDFAQRRKLYYDAGLKDIPGREGLKTIAFELAEQLSRQAPRPDGRWRAPDWYIQAVSGGIGPISVYQGFVQLYDLGLIDKIPRLGLIQVEGCAPMVTAWQNGAETAETVIPRTRITVLSSGDPGRGYTTLRAACLQTGGAMAAVSDGEAFRAMRRMARLEGYSMEPAAAVAFAGLEQLLAQGQIQPDEYVVVNCSGHTFPAEKHILEDQYVLDLQLGQQEGEGGDPARGQVEEGLSAALERLDEQVTTIVVIDDNAQDSRLIRRLLQSYKNYRIFESHNPLDAFDLIRQRKPDLVISDLTMPQMDGFDLLQALKQDPDTASIPVIILSAKTLNPQDLHRLEKADSVWQKGNFNTRELVSHVVKTLGGEGAADETVISATVQQVTAGVESVLDSINRKMVMVIDDNRKDARLVKRILENTQHYTVHEAFSATEALESLAQVAPKLVVLDLVLPDIDNGMHLIEKIRAQAGYEALPIVVLSAKDLTPPEQAYLEHWQVPLWKKTGLDRQALIAYVDQLMI